jgi:alanine racemase
LVPIGYETACSGARQLGEVLINGRRYPVVGRVSMDSFGVDVGTDGRVRVGDA